MYSDLCIEVCKNVSLSYMLKKLAPSFSFEITLLNNIFVSSKSVGDDPESVSYDNLSPLTTSLTIHLYL